MPLFIYWFFYHQRSEEALLIWHVIVIFDIFTTFMTFVTLLWIWIFCIDSWCNDKENKPVKEKQKVTFYDMKEYKQG